MVVPRIFTSFRSRRREELLASVTFPAHVSRGVSRAYPTIGAEAWAEVEQGLRDWLVCCVWGGRRQLGMPSRAVDEAWHQLILDSAAYMEFCDRVFGRYLHHAPEERLSTPEHTLLAGTVRAWDRSRAGQRRESALWDLDERLGIPEPLGVGKTQLVAIRSRDPSLDGPLTPEGAFGEGGLDLGDGWLGGDGGGGCGGGGCGGGL